MSQSTSQMRKRYLCPEETASEGEYDNDLATPYPKKAKKIKFEKNSEQVETKSPESTRSSKTLANENGVHTNSTSNLSSYSKIHTVLAQQHASWESNIKNLERKVLEHNEKIDQIETKKGILLDQIGQEVEKIAKLKRLDETLVAEEKKSKEVNILLGEMEEEASVLTELIEGMRKERQALIGEEVPSTFL